MNVTLKRTIQLLASSVIAGVFLYIAFRNQNLGIIWQEITHVHIGWMLLFIPVSLVSHIIRAWRWKYFLTPVKEDIKVRNLFYSVMIGYFFNSVLPRVGELARPYSIKKLENIPLTTALGSVLVERIIDMISLVIIFAVSLFFFRDALRTAFPWMESGSMIIFIGSIFLLVFMIFLTLKSDQTIGFVKRFMHWLPHNIAYRVEKILRTFIDGLRVIHNKEKYFLVFILSIVMWFLYTLQFWVVFQAFNSISHLNLLAAMVLMVIATIGIIIPMPGGIGTFHFFCSQGLILLFGISKEYALSYATLTHGIGLIYLLIVGAIILIISNFKFSDAEKKLRPSNP